MVPTCLHSKGKMSTATNQRRPSFLKIIIAGYTSDHLMRIPSKFLKHIRHDISERATLKLKTSDCSWHVSVRRTTSGVYFKNGWQEFLDDNCLGNSELLVFTYDGHMHFSIQIFDKGGFGRSDDFPNNSSTHENLNSCNRENPKGKAQKVKQENTGSSEPFEIMEEEEEDSQDSTAKDLKTFKSKIPHIIKTKSTTGVMALPTLASKKNLSPGKSEMYKLENSNGRRSEVRVYPPASSRPSKFPENTSKRPASSNPRKDEPVEILSTEYSEQKEVTKEEEDDSVQILPSFESSDEFKEDEQDDSAQHHSRSESSEHEGFKENEENDSVQVLSISESSEEFKEEEEDTQRTTYGHSKSAEPESFKSIFPHFTSTFRHPTSLRVPTAFSRAHFLEGRHVNVILKNAKGKEWLVKAVPSGRTHVFSAGWPKFAYANHIIFNDICMFELVDRKRNKMVVRKFGKRSY